VRLIGVDAPETNRGRGGPPEPYAEEAKSFTQSNLQDGEVTLEFDAE